MNSRRNKRILPCVIVFVFGLIVSIKTSQGAAVSCSLSVNPRPSNSSSSRAYNGSTHDLKPVKNTVTTTKSHNLKWSAEVRIRENRPDKVEMEVYYLGYNAQGKIVQVGNAERSTLSLDNNGKAIVDLVSPTGTMVKNRTASWRAHYSGSSKTYNGTSHMKTSTSGVMVKGCVVRIFGDGELIKSWSSDSRWKNEAAKADFKVDSLNKDGKIGVR